MPYQGGSGGGGGGTWGSITGTLSNQTDLWVKLRLSPTAVKTANYSPLAEELALYDTTSGSLTGTLPVAPADKTIVAVKMVTQGSTNTVTISAGGSAHFNTTGGGTTAILKLAAQAMMFQYISSTSVWVVLADDLPLGQLDLRYPLVQTAPVAIGNAGATPAVNWTLGRVQTINWNVAASAPVITNPTILGTYELHCLNTSTGAVVVTWPAVVKGPAGTKPQPTTPTGGVPTPADKFFFNWDGTSLTGVNAYPDWR